MGEPLAVVWVKVVCGVCGVWLIQEGFCSNDVIYLSQNASLIGSRMANEVRASCMSTVLFKKKKDK